jgi:hypothetical protein
MPLIARIAALFGGFLWFLAAMYVVGLAFVGFVRWDLPAVYLTCAVIVCGLAVNLFLFKRAVRLNSLPTSFFPASVACLVGHACPYFWPNRRCVVAAASHPLPTFERHDIFRRCARESTE